MSLRPGGSDDILVKHHLVLPMVCSYLLCSDVAHMLSIDRQTHSTSEACFESLLRRDFSRSLKESGDSSARYCRALRLCQAWKAGRSQPPLFLSRRSKRELALNDSGIAVEVTTNGSVQAFKVTKGRLDKLPGALSSPVEEQVSSITHCTLTAGEDPVLIFGGRGGLWSKRLIASDVDGLSASSELFQHSMTDDQPTLASLITQGPRILASWLGCDTIQIWDLETSSSSDICFRGESDAPPGDCCWEVLPREESSPIVSAMDTSRSLMCDFDIRQSQSEPVFTMRGINPMGLFSEIVAASLPKHDPHVRVFSNLTSCFSLDTRLIRAEDLLTIVDEWEIFDVTALTCVNKWTCIAGLGSGSKDPMYVLNVGVNQPKHMFFSAERYYRVKRLVCNDSILAATCTDVNRLFVFSHQQE